jgi:Cohesin domain
MTLGNATSALAGTWMLLLGAGSTLAIPSMSVGRTAGAPGTTDLVSVSVTIDTNVVSLQFDLLYDTNYLTPGAPIGGDALSNQQLYYAMVSPGLYRVLAVSFTDSPLTNGVVAEVPFAIAPSAPDHDEVLVLSNVVLANAQADSVPVTFSSNALLSISVPPHFSAFFPTNAGAMHLELTGTTGRVYVLEAATSLVSPQWILLTTNTDTTGVLSFDDTSAIDFPSRFYRARFER